MSRVKEAREVRGSYGETSGVTCPNCGMRHHPIGEGGELVLCPDCGEKYSLPGGYYKYSLEANK